MVMKAAEDGRRYDAAPALDGAMDRRILVERPMSPQLVIVDSILPQNPAQMGLAQDDDMVYTRRSNSRSKRQKPRPNRRAYSSNKALVRRKTVEK